jgi:nucleolar protein 12
MKRLNSATRGRFSSETSRQKRLKAKCVHISLIPSCSSAKVGSSLQPLLKQFKKHILSFVPSARIESVRFRSIAFQKPTTKLPNDADDTGKTPPKQQKQPRQHDVDRVSSWRESNDAEASIIAAEKKYLTPQEKKRVAFIKHDFHEGMDVVTAYVVFAHPQPPHMRAANVPAPAPVLDPYQSARSAVEKCNGSVFNHRTLRVDYVHDNTRSHASGGSTSGDPKLTIFVGNLDFESKEEDLRAFFEGLVSTERGQRAQEPDAAKDDEPRSCSWVTRVRLIRDKDTQLGKGFAYVQFTVSYISFSLSLFSFHSFISLPP